jgi:hypothetical protein
MSLPIQKERIMAVKPLHLARRKCHYRIQEPNHDGKPTHITSVLQVIPLIKRQK